MMASAISLRGYAILIHRYFVILGSVEEHDNVRVRSMMADSRRSESGRLSSPVSTFAAPIERQLPARSLWPRPLAPRPTEADPPARGFRSRLSSTAGAIHHNQLNVSLRLSAACILPSAQEWTKGGIVNKYRGSGKPVGLMHQLLPPLPGCCLFLIFRIPVPPQRKSACSPLDGGHLQTENGHGEWKSCGIPQPNQ